MFSLFWILDWLPVVVLVESVPACPWMVLTAAVLLIDGDVLAVEEIAAIDLGLRAKRIPGSWRPGPDSRHAAIRGCAAPPPPRPVDPLRA